MIIESVKHIFLNSVQMLMRVFSFHPPKHTYNTQEQTRKNIHQLKKNSET